MKPKHILKYIISSFLFFVCLVSYGQQKEVKDSVVIKNKYGLRVGVDLFNPIANIVEGKRKGFEIVADYRISKNWYIATELGSLQNDTNLDYIDFTTNGQYIKVGADYNAYENWLDMDNVIYLGLRYGFSGFSQTLNRAEVYSPAGIPVQNIETPLEFNGLNAHWAEVVVGVKAEVFNNLYLGFSFSGKRLLSDKEPDNFKNLFIPGFNRVYLNRSGFGINYTISYLIPLYKKDK